MSTKPKRNFGSISEISKVNKRTAQKKEDKSPYVFQSKKAGLSFALDCRIPWTTKQQELLDLIQDKDCKLLFINGPAGVGKSLLAVYAGLLALKEKQVSNIVYVRTLVESSSKSMGYLPGTSDEKLSIYLEPVLGKLEEVCGLVNAKNLVDSGTVIGKPVNFLRGCQFSGKFVIFDENQNATMSEDITFLTRIGEFSKVIVCGDPSQSDIGKAGAFNKFYDLFNDEDSKANGVYTFEFDEEDIMRSKLLKFLVKKFKQL